MKKFTIVIPTRERAETLKYTLKACTAQNYENLDIIVCDNRSTDHTEEVVKGCQDPRVRYVKTPKRLGMSENWEYALSHVTGDFVTYLGDDDGLLPDAVSISNQLLTKHPYKSLIWSKAAYTWPSDLSSHKSILSFSTENSTFVLSGMMLLKMIGAGLTSYGRIPMIYSGFVSVESILKIKKRTGRFFYSITPDVYSGFALISEAPEYLYTLYPLGVGGTSKHSNGASFFSKEGSEKRKLFFKESTLPIHPKMQIISGSLTSAVTEALLQANDHCFDGTLSFNMKRIFKKIAQEVSTSDPYMYQLSWDTLEGMSLDRKMKRHLRKLKKSFVNHPIQQTSDSQDFLSSKKISLDASAHALNTIDDACQFVSKTLPTYNIPQTIQRYTWSNFLYGKLFRYTERVTKSRIFP